MSSFLLNFLNLNFCLKHRPLTSAKTAKVEGVILEIKVRKISVISEMNIGFMKLIVFSYTYLMNCIKMFINNVIRISPILHILLCKAMLVVIPYLAILVCLVIILVLWP